MEYQITHMVFTIYSTHIVAIFCVFLYQSISAYRYVCVCVCVFICCQTELQRVKRMVGLSAPHEIEREFDKFESKKLQDIKVSVLNSV